MPTGPYGEQCRGHKKSENAIRTTLLRLSVMRLTSDKPLRCKGVQRIAKYGNMISRGVGNIWQSFQIGGYECIKREYVTPIKRGAIAVFVDVGSSSLTPATVQRRTTTHENSNSAFDIQSKPGQVG